MSSVVLFSIFSSIFNSTNTILTKDIVNTMDLKDGITYSMLFSSLVSIIPCLFNWNFNINIISILILILVSILQFSTISIGNYLIKTQGVASSNIYIRLNIILTFFIDIILKNTTVNIKTILFLILFTVSIHFFLKDKNELDFLKSKKTIFLLIINILAFTIRPYLMKLGYSNNLFSNSTFMFLNFSTITIICFLTFKTKPNYNLKSLKSCATKSLIKPISTFCYNQAVAVGNISIVQSFASLDIIFTPILSFIIYKEKLSKNYIIAISSMLIALNLLI